MSSGILRRTFSASARRDRGVGVPLRGFGPALCWNPSSTGGWNKIGQNRLPSRRRRGRGDTVVNRWATTRQSPSQSWSWPMAGDLEAEITLGSLKRWCFSLWFSHYWQKRGFVVRRELEKKHCTVRWENAQPGHNSFSYLQSGASLSRKPYFLFALFFFLSNVRSI